MHSHLWGFFNLFVPHSSSSPCLLVLWKCYPSAIDWVFVFPRPHYPKFMLWKLTPSVTVFERSQWHPTPVLSPGKSPGWRSLVGCSPRDCWGSDATERLHFHFHALEKERATHSCFCLENPRDGGAWWAAIYGVAQSRTRLKRLSKKQSEMICGCEWSCHI